MDNGKFNTCHQLIFYYRARNLFADLCDLAQRSQIVGTSSLIISGCAGARASSGDCSRSALKLRMLSIVDTGLPVSYRT